MTRHPALRIGTRGSPLALAQAVQVRQHLMAADPSLDDDDVVIVTIATTGDRIQDRPLSQLGGKGLFTKEIEEALLDGRIDLAVHSMKDVPTALPDGLAIVACLERADPRDALLSDLAARPGELPQGARVGTSSLRRQAQLLNRRPDLRVLPFRGNVNTRLRKLAEGEVDATLLACAGLARLGMGDRVRRPIEPDEMLPAVAQGAIGIEIRLDATAMHRRLAAIDHAATSRCVNGERAFLEILDGSCRTPIAAYARAEADGRLRLDAEVLSPDGRIRIAVSRTGSAGDAVAMGRDAGEEVRGRMPEDLFGVAP